MSKLQVGTAAADRGTKAYGVLRAGETNDGAPILIPVGVVHGDTPGPVLWIQNGVHGMEYVGMGALQRILRDLQPQGLTGSLVCIPMVNILAYRAGTRIAPQDGLDMNRIYPGAPLERAMHVFAHSEMVIHTIFTEIQRVASHIIDCHAGGWFTCMSAYVQHIAGDSEVEKVSQRMAEASGMTLVWSATKDEVREKAPNSLKLWASQAGIPAITLEKGGQGLLRDEDIQPTIQAILNVMMYLGMLEGKRSANGEQYRVLRGHWLRPQTGGALWCKAKPLDRVKKGQVLLTITNLLGEEREQLVAPVDGVVVGIRTLGTVNSGEYCGNVGELES